MMLDMLIERRNRLKEELEAGRQLLQKKEDELVKLRETLRRITGAIDTFEELIEDEKQREADEARQAGDKLADENPADRRT